MALEIGYAELADHVGRDLGPSEWHRVSQPLVNQFAEATDDRQWIHLDTERAGREMGGTIAHGFLILSLLPMMMEDMLRVEGAAHILNYGLNRVRFTRPVPVGSRVRGRQRILSVEERGNARMVVSEMIVEIEGVERPACVAESLMLYIPAGAAEAAPPAPQAASLA